jgi:hypothetical protein
MSKTLTYYFLGAAAYGVVRKIAQVWDAKTTSYNRSYQDKPKHMPLGDKLGIVLCSAVLAPYILPLWINCDINYIDIKCRGLDPKEYFNHDDDISMFNYILK